VAPRPSIPPGLHKLHSATQGCILSQACGLGNCLDRPGKLLAECSAAAKLRQLEQAIRDLPLKNVGEVQINDAARTLLMATWEGVSARSMARRGLHKSGLKGKPGRPREVVGDHVGIKAALIYEELTGTRVSRKIVSDAWNDEPPASPNKPYGDWHHFLEKVFSVLGIDARADGVNQRLQADLKRYSN
jgi:hypothetical protein